MSRTIWKLSVTSIATVALMFGASPLCMAIGNTSYPSADIYASTSSFGNAFGNDFDFDLPTAQSLLVDQIGIDHTSARSQIIERVPESLDLENAESIGSDLGQLWPEDGVGAPISLPSVDNESGLVSLTDPESNEKFSLKPLNHEVSETVDGVVVAKSNDGSETSVTVSHITSDISGQIVGVVKDSNTHFLDFGYSIPNGYHLSSRSDGGFELLDANGTSEGEIAAPWAIDAEGKQVPTHFELIGNNTIRQHIDTKAATFPVTVDPEWSWWLVTAGKCAVSLAPVLATGGAAIASRVPKLVSFINKLAKTPRIAAAVQKVGGVGNAAVSIIKHAVQQLRGKLPKDISVKLPNISITPAEKTAALVLWPFLVDNF